MKTVSIRELHTRTGHYVRAAARQPIIVTDRGREVARLVPGGETGSEKPFLKRKLRTKFKKLLARPMTGRDSGELISEDRDRP